MHTHVHMLTYAGTLYTHVTRHRNGSHGHEDQLVPWSLSATVGAKGAGPAVQPESGEGPRPAQPSPAESRLPSPPLVLPRPEGLDPSQGELFAGLWPDVDCIQTPPTGVPRAALTQVSGGPGPRQGDTEGDINSVLRPCPPANIPAP